MSSELKKYFPVAKALSMLLYPHAEVVVHNLKTGHIAAIFNSISKRTAGDESLIDVPKAREEFPDVFPIYAQTGWDGRKIKSISATLRDTKGNAIGIFCINLDISKWEMMHQFIGEWLHGVNEQEKPEALFKDDWREKINSYVKEYLKDQGTSLKAMSKEKKRELVRSLHQQGAFTAKNAALYVADVLELSRATIYNYLR